MRVLHLVSSGQARGAQRYVAALCAELRRTGSDSHEIATLFATPGGDAIAVDHPSAVRHDRGIWVDPRSLRTLRRVVGRGRWDVLVCHGLEPMKYAALLPVRRRPGIVCLAIGVIQEQACSGLRWEAYRRAIRPAAAVAAVSDDVADQLRGLFGLSTVTVIANGRDPAVFTKPAQPQDVPRLAFVGSLDAGKRPEVFVEVVRTLRERGIPLRASMAGTGPLASALAPSAAAAGIEMLGLCSDVPGLLADSAVLVLTSGRLEGMPGVLIEAGLAGLPAVTTDVPGARDVIVDEVTGRIVDPDDIAGLIDAVAELLADPASRQAMGAAARKRCTARFSVAAGAASWLALLEHAAVTSRG